MTALAEILEKDFSAQIYELARMLGWRRFHTFNSKRSPRGFPDEVLCRERVVFVEVKRERTKTTFEQREWLRALRDAGAEVYLIRPRNLQDLAAVLGPKTTFQVAQARLRLLDELDRELAR